METLESVTHENIYIVFYIEMCFCFNPCTYQASRSRYDDYIFMIQDSHNTLPFFFRFFKKYVLERQWDPYAYLNGFYVNVYFRSCPLQTHYTEIFSHISSTVASKAKKMNMRRLYVQDTRRQDSSRFKQLNIIQERWLMGKKYF